MAYIQYLDKQQYMSLFLLPDNQLYEMCMWTSGSPLEQSYQSLLIRQKRILSEHLQSEMKKMSQLPVVVKKENHLFLQYHYISGLIQQKYHMVQCLKLNKHKATIEMTLIFTIPQGLLFKIQNMNSYVHILNQITFRSATDECKYINIYFNINNGLIQARFPILYLFNHFIETSLSKNQSTVYKLFRFQIQQSLNLLDKILASNNIQKPYTLQTIEKKSVWESIYRYNQMINISSHLNQSYLASEAQIRQNNKIKKSDIKKIIKNRKTVENCIIKNNVLFEQHIFLTQSIPKSQSDFQLTREDQNYVQFVVGMPQNPKIKNAQENSMILNHINIKNDMNALAVSKVNEGGFASLFLTQINYQYVYSAEGHESLSKKQNKNDTSFINKFVIVKKSTTRQQEGRIDNQIQILKQLKNGVSIFLPKYYVAVNKECFFTNSIIMDYIPFKNLKQYLQSNSITISLITKLYLIFSITQSLRFIRDYSIVHLDLKSANIMIFCNLIIKLIDFGESYHPLVSKQKHNPGHTVPYSSPEVYFQYQDDFNSKSDVYSLGVIIYEIIYNRLPFKSSQNTQLDDNLMEDYFSRWYCMPQQLEVKGQIKIMRLLNMIIFKCLSPRRKDRPELDWIALIIRQCFEIIN